jgi:acyl carrier protein|tara:strand:+ start:1183 stop:1437 length:255 start_codon:yes stop_codon:yes gene_type:complete
MALKKEKVLKKLKLIFFEIFKNKKLKINFNSSANTIKNWDSLAQINIVLATEKLFKVKFSVTEVSELKNVGEIIDLIIKKNGKI